MRKIFTLFVFVLLAGSLLFSRQVNAQAPDKMSYQAVVRNSDGELVADQVVGLRVSIVKNSIDGIIVYRETYDPIPETNSNGLLTIKIGAGVPLTGKFSEIDWADGPYFIITETDPSGGTDYTITGASQLLSVPYALHARTVEETNVITYEIGDFAHGGVVFYVEPCGTKGLVAAIEDQNGGSGVNWSSSNYLTLTNSNGVYAGKKNTTTFLAVSMANNDVDLKTAARVCAYYRGGNYGDWYLPSLEELYLIHINREAINKTAVENGGGYFSGNNYWSSQEDGENRAWRLDNATGNPVSTVKLPIIQPRVRAVRAF